MEQSKHAKSSSDAGAGGEDHLSALPDDALVLILLRLNTKEAARSSVLCRRWRHVWTLLPVLRFGLVRDSNCLPSALSASEVALRHLHVGDPDASPQSLAAWLPAAARRVSGNLFLHNFVPWRKVVDGEAGASQRGTFELPCFEKATSICLSLGFLGISFPPAGVFARLTDLDLSGVRFQGPGELGDAVSSPRCPCLHTLTICNALGLYSITINSESLQLLDLEDLPDVRQVTIVAPLLKEFTLLHCFLYDDEKQPVVNISAPQLKSLNWADAYDPSSVYLGTMEHLETLAVFFSVYGLDGFAHNRACLMLLPHFKAIENLVLSLGYLQEIDNLQYFMEDMTMLPDVTSLELNVMARGHAFGASLFHILRICSGIKRLKLVLSSCSDLEEEIVCTGCICDQLTNWKTEELPLICLQEIEIKGLRGSEHEVAFVKQLLHSVTMLNMMTVTFSRSVTERKAKLLFEMFQSFSRPGVCMKFYIYQELRKVIYAPKD